MLRDEFVRDPFIRTSLILHIPKPLSQSAPKVAVGKVKV
jgi:hypothetical protein